jgi:hypothetical protein
MKNEIQSPVKIKPLRTVRSFGLRRRRSTAELLIARNHQFISSKTFRMDSGQGGQPGTCGSPFSSANCLVQFPMHT